jgi:hypothetical protein
MLLPILHRDFLAPAVQLRLGLRMDTKTGCCCRLSAAQLQSQTMICLQQHVSTVSCLGTGYYPFINVTRMRNPFQLTGFHPLLSPCAGSCNMFVSALAPALLSLVLTPSIIAAAVTKLSFSYSAAADLCYQQLASCKQHATATVE